MGSKLDLGSDIYKVEGLGAYSCCPSCNFGKNLVSDYTDYSESQLSLTKTRLLLAKPRWWRRLVISLVLDDKDEDSFKKVHEEGEPLFPELPLGMSLDSG